MKLGLKSLKASIKTKIIIATSITISILVVVISSTIFFYFHSLLKESIFKQQFILVSEMADQLNGRINLARHQLALAATGIDARVLADQGELEKALVNASPANMIFDAGFLVIGTDGRVMAESMGFPEMIGKNLSFRDYVREPLKNGKPFLSTPFRLSVPPNSPMIAMTIPVRDNSDKVIALLVGYHSLGADQFLTSISSELIGSTSYLYILHGRTLLMHPDKKRILEVLPEGKNAGIDQALLGFEGTLDNVNSKGQHMLSSFKKVGQTGWIMSANTPYDDAFGPLKNLGLVVLAISLFGALLSLAVIWSVTRRLILPIGQLTDHLVSANVDGEGWEPVDLQTGDEIECLAGAFNNMMGEVQETKLLLKYEKDFFSGIIQNAAAPMFVIDHNHKIIFWNSALAKLTGKSSFQMVGTKQQWSPFYPTKRPVLADLVLDSTLERAGELYSSHSSSLFNAGALRAEGWYEKLGGKRRYIFFEAAPIKNNNNEIIAVVETLEDITERKLAEEATSAHNLFLQEILDAIPNPVYYKDANGLYLGCNAAFKAFFGKTSEEIIGRTLLEIMPEAYSGTSVWNDQAVMSSGGSAEYETELLRGDGKVRNVLVRKASFSYSDGLFSGLVGAFVDITEQRQLDEQIRKMSRAIEQSPATILITNVEGSIEYVNPKFCQTTGYSAEEVIGQTPRILKSGEMTPEGYANLWKTITSGKEWRGEFHNKRKDGSLYWEYASISPLFDKDGKISGYLAVKEDITERKAVEAELAKSRLEMEVNHAKLEQLFAEVAHGKREWEETLDNLRDFIILTDADNRIRRCNQLLAESTGQSVNDLAGVDWRKLLTGAGYSFGRFDGKSGELRNERLGRVYDINVYEIVHEGTLEGHVISMNDTTELRAASLELEKAYAELKEAQLQIFQQEKMASIGQLAAGVAHEINNPMGFISSNLTTLTKYVDRLAEYIGAGDQALADFSESSTAKALKETRKRLKIDHIMEDSRQLIMESQDGAGRVRRIVQDLKSFSRVDQSEKALIDLNEALETTINIAWNEIKYVAELNKDFGNIPQIICFPQQLNQVFLNLLVNASHAMEGKRGIITVRSWNEGESVFVSVTDSGCGIPEEIRQRIFEPFFTTKEVGKGTGLGLSISYEIIRKHGGEITVESEVGKGTTFVVRLPVSGPRE